MLLRLAHCRVWLASSSLAFWQAAPSRPGAGKRFSIRSRSRLPSAVTRQPRLRLLRSTLQQAWCSSRAPCWPLSPGCCSASDGGSSGAYWAGFLGFQRASRVTPLLERIERGGWRAVALLRLIPIIPHSLANFGLGLTRLPLGAYAFGSFVGQLPLTIAYAELGAAGERLLIGGAGWIQPTLIGLAVLSLSLLSPAYFSRRSRRPAKAFGSGPPVAQSRSSTVCTIGTGQPPAS
jgi:hypothetical protein